VLTTILVLFAIYTAILALYLLTLHRSLRRCAPENRAMDPAKVWLQLIPVFGLAWHFVNVRALGESFENEYRSRGMSATRPHQSLGIAMGVCLIAGYGMTGLLYLLDPGSAAGAADSTVSATDSLRSLAGFVALAGVVSTALYWMRVYRVGKELGKPAASASEVTVV
jgi:hypothetical protein